MKKAILITLAVMAAQAPLPAQAEGPTAYTVLLAGGSSSNEIEIWLSADGTQYVIDSIVPLEVGSTICAHASGSQNELLCQAVEVGAFEMNADGGDDQVRVAPEVTIPVTMRGGTGNDTLVGGDGPDKLVGGPGNDRVVGRGGADVLFGGPGHDAIFGGPGADVIHGGPDRDKIVGGPGRDEIFAPNHPVRG
jgi:hypothetical protein